MEEIKEEGKVQKILVTGSSGMLGTDLCRKLENDHDVIGLDIARPEADIQCDITDRDRTVKAIVSARPDLIIHAAAWADADGCEKDPSKAKRINENGTENVAISASELNIPLIYISTDFVFDGEKKTPYTEEDLPNPVNVYARSKLDGEKKVAGLNKYLILRTGWLYGANGKNFVDTILEEAKKKRELKVVDDQIGCPTYTKDFAKAIVRLINEICQIYHVSNKGEVSWFDYAKEIFKIAKIDNIKLIPIKSNQLARPARRPAFSALNNGKFEKRTGFVMRPWQEALRDYLDEKR